MNWIKKLFKKEEEGYALIGNDTEEEGHRYTFTFPKHVIRAKNTKDFHKKLKKLRVINFFTNGDERHAIVIATTRVKPLKLTGQMLFEDGTPVIPKDYAEIKR